MEKLSEKSKVTKKKVSGIQEATVGMRKINTVRNRRRQPLNTGCDSGAVACI